MIFRNRKVVCPHCSGDHFFRATETLVMLEKRGSSIRLCSETPAISTTYECSSCGKYELTQKELDPIEQKELNTQNKYILNEVKA
ncbi:MAG: hypothetical protein ABIH20_02660 [Candidatus Diapherotrites archaeon]